MTDLKCVTSADKPAGDDVTYVWMSSQKRRKKIVAKRPDVLKKEGDPMFIPWGDIVESPLRLFRRLFDLS